ncbi:7478bee1-08ef-43b5-b3db-57e1a9e32801 [Thermothielavioides terrestris]|uniref:7478bee1-08ef-43b5-b3db-57e1a9e32801 n=1 Tax=Thermothielavioides terrestris TaxID=2587410 RepID=A0A3S4C7G2_9PEZI|nr:7478bee1-08ef-43b5-b3db-57e1a9e32801 [Thermothielavioides terrestris]
MATLMEIDNPRKRFRCDDHHGHESAFGLPISKKTRLSAPLDTFYASPRDESVFPQPSPPPPPAPHQLPQQPQRANHQIQIQIQADDGAAASAASTPASIESDSSDHPFSAARWPPQQQPQPAAHGRCTIISGWNQARRMELCLQGYPPALALQLGSWQRAQA